MFSDGALMRSDDVHVLCGVLLGLNSIDFRSVSPDKVCENLLKLTARPPSKSVNLRCHFSFDIRSCDLDQPFMPVIDYSPYLKLKHG